MHRSHMGANKVTIKQYERVLTTYPYSDPDPLPVMSAIYPYYRYDGFTDTAVQQQWKVVELSNKYIRLLILPQIGGKIWAAIDKTNGKSFIYFNHVVKFRDVSLRGPYTSGGIEANYGIIGHTPNCFSPVDYLVRHNPDGSASCIIGTLDLLTRSTWRLDIRLDPGQAFFTTRSIWHNGSGMEQPEYSWMNAAVKAGGDLQFIFRGTHDIYHDGRASTWPVDQKPRDLTWYANNNFGGYKSYHVLGRFSEFYGAYWHDENFGMAHYAAYGDRPGRKIWIWGLSRQGMIWDQLLTDTDGQYVELQSGRLFNQARPQSSLTPFKQVGFPPYDTQRWMEHWMPVKGIGGFVSASPWGAMNVTGNGKRLLIGISPIRPLRDTLEVFDGNRLLFSREVNLIPNRPVKEMFSLAAPPRKLRVCLGGDKIEYVAGDEDVLTRPLTAPANFDWKSPYGLYLKGKDLARQKDYVQAASTFRKCLKRDSNFLPALVEMASLANRRADYTEARDFGLKALSIDTYDPAANYQFGLASAGLGRHADAKAAFSIAGLSTGWRSAACTELAGEYLREKRYDRALASAREGLDLDRFNLTAMSLEACINRLSGNRIGADAALNALLALDPLSHFAEFEKYLMGKATALDFTGKIRNELAYQTYLELACWYHSLGLDKEALQALDLAPTQTEVLYWQAYLRRDTGLLALANAASPLFVFPFRSESIPVFEWAIGQSRGWQPKYYLALIRWFQGDLPKARELLSACGDQPAFAPFFAARAQVIPQDATKDLQRAAKLDPMQWRHGAMLARHFLARNNAAAADAVVAGYAQRFPRNGTLVVLHAKTLIATGQYQAAGNLLASANLLASEGNTDAHSLYREAYLMLALARMKAGSFDQALKLIKTARRWPENLGAGKPYTEDIDVRLENWLAFRCYLRLKSKQRAQTMLQNILAFQLWPKTRGLGDSTQRFTYERGAGDIVHAMALKQSGQALKAQEILDDWLKQNPGSKIARWGAAILTGKPAALPVTVQDQGCRVLAAWLRNGERR